MARTGTRVSFGDDPSAMVQSTTGGLGDANFQRRALGVGNPGAPGSDVGKQLAVWARQGLQGASGSEFIIGHNLGEVPALVTLERWTGDNWLIVNGVREETWTASSVRVKAWTGAANLNGFVATFRVSGR